MSFSLSGLYRTTLFYLFLSIFGAQTLIAASFKVGIAPSLPEPVEEVQEQDNSLEAKIRRGLKVKSKHETEHTPRQRTLTSLELPNKYQVWKSILDHLSKETGMEFELVQAKSQLSFELGLAKGRFDFAYVSPLQFMAFKDRPGYKAIAKRKAQPIRGIIYVRKNSSLRTLKQLQGETIAFPSPLNFEGSVAIRQSLNQANFDFTPQFFGGVDEVYAEVAQSKFLAGAGMRETFLAQPPEIRQALHIIWDSPGYTPYPFIAHPRVPFLSIIKLQRAMANLDKSEETKTLLKHIFVNNGFEVAKNNDWNDVELIDLEHLNRHTSTAAPMASPINTN